MVSGRAEQRGLSIGVPAVLLVLVGGISVVVAFRFLDWYAVPSSADSAGDVTFGKLHDTADQLSGAGAASAYFDWLAWLLVIAVVLIGVGAALPVPPADALRVAGFLVGLLGVGATYFAVAQLRNAQVSAGAARHSIFDNSTWGLWATFAGFALATVGAALGPWRGRR
jgi:hypothetical protein